MPSVSNTLAQLKAALLAVITKSRNEAQVKSAKARPQCCNELGAFSAVVPGFHAGAVSSPGEGDAGRISGRAPAFVWLLACREQGALQGHELCNAQCHGPGDGWLTPELESVLSRHVECLISQDGICKAVGMKQRR